ncbi:cytochrome b/b6 domain-containing protein [Pseudomonas poae]|nr:cytochrome b/b6 domain-containing protein [Pseudomonas poae]
MKAPNLRPKRYNLTGRLLHWLMAVLLLSTLFIGVAMSSALQWRPQLLSAHLLLGVGIFVLAVMRICNRWLSPSPTSPEGLTLWHTYGLAAVHLAFYGLMTMLPLIGWAMLSAGGYPTPSVLGKALPVLVQPDPRLYAALQQTHALLAYAFFALILLHLAAALFHVWIKRDGVFSRMGFGPNK